VWVCHSGAIEADSFLQITCYFGEGELDCNETFYAMGAFDGCNSYAALMRVLWYFYIVVHGVLTFHTLSTSGNPANLRYRIVLGVSAILNWCCAALPRLAATSCFIDTSLPKVTNAMGFLAMAAMGLMNQHMHGEASRRESQVNPSGKT
jgi:hypothetical protein